MADHSKRSKMRKSSTLVTAPTSEPVTLAEFKAWARIDDTTEDNLLTNMIIGARQEVEKYLKSVLITQTWDLTIDLCSSELDNTLGDGVYDLPITALYGDLPSVIDLPYAPVQSITSVTTYDLDNASSVFSSTNYTLDTAGGRFILDYGSSYPSNLRKNASMVIRYVAGYGSASDVPFSIRMAIMSLAQSFYESRGLCANGQDPIKDMQSKLASFRKVML